MSNLVGIPEDRFSHDLAHIPLTVFFKNKIKKFEDIIIPYGTNIGSGVYVHLLTLGSGVHVHLLTLSRAFAVHTHLYIKYIITCIEINRVKKPRSVASNAKVAKGFNNKGADQNADLPYSCLYIQRAGIQGVKESNKTQLISLFN